MRCKPGDVFLFFSDGITDATSSRGSMFGRGRLEKIALKNVRSQCRRDRPSHLQRCERARQGRRRLRRPDHRRAQSERKPGPKVSDSRPQERPPAFTYSRIKGKSQQRELSLTRSRCVELATLRHAAVCVFRHRDSPEIPAVRWSLRGMRTHHLLLGESELEPVDSEVAGFARCRIRYRFRRRASACAARRPQVGWQRSYSPASASWRTKSTSHLNAGILLFNVESPSELQLLSARATHLRKTARFADSREPRCGCADPSLHLDRLARA